LKLGSEAEWLCEAAPNGPTAVTRTAAFGQPCRQSGCPRKAGVDPKLRFAARDGKSEPIHIEETDTSFAIGWKGRYRIEGPAFVYSDHDTGRISTILGYPIDKLSQTA
jgi:hypothetical protein